MSTESETPIRQSWWMWIILLPLLYLLCTGPLTGVALWLEARTAWSGHFMKSLEIFYWPLAVEWPVGEAAKEKILSSYVEWWVLEVFQFELPFIPPPVR